MHTFLHLCKLWTHTVASGDSGDGGGVVGSLGLCCRMTKCLCVIVHHCYASLCLCLAAVQHRSLTPYCLGFFPLPSHYSNMGILLEKSSFNTDLISQQREKQKRRTIFPAEYDSLQSFSSLLTLKSHDWNTEYGYLHSRSFVLLCSFPKPQRRTLSAASVFCCWGDTITEIEHFAAPHCIMSIDN